MGDACGLHAFAVIDGVPSEPKQRMRMKHHLPDAVVVPRVTSQPCGCYIIIARGCPPSTVAFWTFRLRRLSYCWIMSQASLSLLLAFRGGGGVVMMYFLGFDRKRHSAIELNQVSLTFRPCLNLSS